MRPLIALLTIAAAVFAQPSSSDPSAAAQLKSELLAVRDAALSDDYAFQQVAHLSDNIGARPAGSPQAQAAVDYVADELRKLGLEVRLEPVQVPHWVRRTDAAELIDYPGRVPQTQQKIFVTALGGNTPTPTPGLTADLVVAHSFDELQSLGSAKVTGKIVLFDVPFDKQKAAAGLAGEAYGEAVAYRSNGPKSAADLGAAACLVRSVGGADYRLPHTGFSLPAGIPAGAVSAEDAGLIARLAAQGNVRMHLTLTSQNEADVPSYNVVADLRGSEYPEQLVIVSGHIDSWDLGTGAIDDGAGVAVAMETAELLHRLNLHPRRTIRVIAWMDEENGGRGHDAYAKDHAKEMTNHSAAIESDLGAGHPFGFEAKINPDALPLLKPVQEVLQSFGANVIHISSRSPGSDVAPLSRAGIPTFGLMQDGRTYFNYHHSAADTLDKINPQELRENAAAMAVLADALANLEVTLPR